MGLALGLASSLVWGTADFLGGVYTRRLTLAPVAVGSQIAGLVALLIAAVFIGDIEGRALEIGLAAGACGAVGLSAFYRALATGTISIVSPVSACGALVPVGLALAMGERPGALALAGSAAGLAGAVLASVHEIRGDHPAARSSIGLALVAALGIGGFLWFLGRAADGGHTLSALLGARLGSLALLSIGVALTRSSIAVPLSEVPAIALIGLLDTAANGLFAVAIQHGYITVVSVLGSEYPVVTVMLAHVFLGERITRPQKFGVALVLAGVGMVAAA
ncbi:MAG: EamA family transporter [Gaiellales bacterium]